jgi:hypothetical protein
VAEKQKVDDFLTNMEEEATEGPAQAPPVVITAPVTVPAPPQEEKEEEGDLLAGFFSELTEVSKEKERVKEEKATEARDQLLSEKYTNQDLGTGKEQYARLTQTNYIWKNQNPFVVMQLGIDATEEDIKYR